MFNTVTHSPCMVFMTLCMCREQLIHKLGLEAKEHEEKLEREKAKKMTELEVQLFHNFCYITLRNCTLLILSPSVQGEAAR